MLLPGVFRDQKEKTAKETTLIHAMNRLGAVSLFLDLVKGVHARPIVERRGRERRAKRGRQTLRLAPSVMCEVIRFYRKGL